MIQGGAMEIIAELFGADVGTRRPNVRWEEVDRHLAG